MGRKIDIYVHKYTMNVGVVSVAFRRSGILPGILALSTINCKSYDPSETFKLGAIKKKKCKKTAEVISFLLEIANFEI